MYLSIGASNPEEIRQGNTGMFYVYCQKMHTQRHWKITWYMDWCTDRRRRRRGRRRGRTWPGRWRRLWSPLVGRWPPRRPRRRSETGPAGCWGTASAGLLRLPPPQQARRRGRGRPARSPWHWDRKPTTASFQLPGVLFVSTSRSYAGLQEHWD